MSLSSFISGALADVFPPALSAVILSYLRPVAQRSWVCERLFVGVALSVSLTEYSILLLRPS